MVMGVDLRSSDLDTGLSSSDNTMGMEVDKIMSKPSSSSLKKHFHTLAEKCVLEEKPFTRLGLKSRYQGRVQATLDFALSIEDFNKLVDPRSSYDQFVGPEPSTYVSRLIHREERSKCLDFVLLPH